MTTEIISESSNVFETVPARAQKIKSVEGRLWEAYGDLAVTEANVHFLCKLHQSGLSTNDVKNFAKKQTTHKRTDKSTDHKVVKSAMKSKVVDALAQAKRIRQQKNLLKKRVEKKYRTERLNASRFVKTF